jgi:hypothetical protein
LVEWFKTDKNQLKSWLKKLRYATIEIGMNFIAVHESDKCLGHMKDIR